MTRRNTMNKLVALLLLAIVALPLATGCVDGGSEEASPTPTEAPIVETPTLPPGGSPCGDGVCEGPENPVNCPEDCAPVVTPSRGDGDGDQPQPPSGGEEPTRTPASGPGGEATPPPDDEEPPPATAERWGGSTDFTCHTVGDGVEDLWRAYIDFEFTVAPDGTITGSGSGEFTEAWCARANCEACEFTDLSSISAEVSGTREGFQFHLRITPSADMSQYLTCSGIRTGGWVNQIVPCLTVSGGPGDFAIDAEDQAIVEWEGSREGIGATMTGRGTSTVWRP
jgi:hypothetical protein